MNPHLSYVQNEVTADDFAEDEKALLNEVHMILGDK